MGIIVVKLTGMMNPSTEVNGKKVLAAIVSIFFDEAGTVARFLIKVVLKMQLEIFHHLQNPKNLLVAFFYF